MDEFNPDIPEWRHDVSRVIKKALLQVSDFHFLCPSASLLPSFFVFSSHIFTLLLNYFPYPYYLRWPILLAHWCVSRAPQGHSVIHQPTGAETPLLPFPPKMASLIFKVAHKIILTPIS